MSENLISVVVPVYNIENYISKTIDSILNQTYKYLEVIVVDDGSTDKSGEIIDSIAEKDSRVKIIHKQNGGVTSARIEGIKASTGEWIGFVDGDDYIEPNMYEDLLDNALKYDADISHCGYQMVFPSRVDYYYNTKKFIVQNNAQGVYDLLGSDYIEPGLWNKLVKADIVKKVISDNLIDTSIKINEDLLMNYFFFKLSEKSVYNDNCPYHYMLREGSAATSKVNKNKLYDPIKVQKIILDDAKDNDKLTNIIYGRLAGIYISGASMKNPNKEPYIDEYIKMCKVALKEMQNMYFRVPRGKSNTFKYKLCCFSPALYRCFHGVYSKVKGTDKKYEVR